MPARSGHERKGRRKQHGEQWDINHDSYTSAGKFQGGRPPGLFTLFCGFLRIFALSFFAQNILRSHLSSKMRQKHSEKCPKIALNYAGQKGFPPSSALLPVRLERSRFGHSTLDPRPSTLDPFQKTSRVWSCQ